MLRGLFDEIASGQIAAARRRLEAAPELATQSLADAEGYFVDAIHHHVGGGDTALHVAAAAYQGEFAERLVKRGADVRARNWRGAEPLHYAADGRPGATDWDPVAQSEVITYLIRAGADPNATNKSGVAPLHRAVRTRSSNAVGALIANGANPRLPNKAGSTPLHLAVQNTGKSNSGSAAAKREQGLVIALLLEHGARPTDVDATGKSVMASATSAWIRRMLDGG